MTWSTTTGLWPGPMSDPGGSLPASGCEIEGSAAAAWPARGPAI